MPKSLHVKKIVSQFRSFSSLCVCTTPQVLTERKHKSGLEMSTMAVKSGVIVLITHRLTQNHVTINGGERIGKSNDNSASSSALPSL